MAIPILPVLFGSLKFVDNKITAYLLVLSVLFLDSGQASLFGNQGVIGNFFSWIINAITGFNIFLPSWFILFFFMIFPFLGWAVANTKT